MPSFIKRIQIIRTNFTVDLTSKEEPSRLRRQSSFLVLTPTCPPCKGQNPTKITMTQPPPSRHYPQPRSRSATRAPRSASMPYDSRTTVSNKSRQALMPPQPSPLNHRAKSVDRKSMQSRKRSSSIQRHLQTSNTSQYPRTQPPPGLTRIAIHRRSTSALENGSVLSAPSFQSYYSREFREPTNTKPVMKKVARDQSPANSRKSPSEKTQKNTKTTRKLIEGKDDAASTRFFSFPCID